MGIDSAITDFVIKVTLDEDLLTFMNTDQRKVIIVAEESYLMRA